MLGKKVSTIKPHLNNFIFLYVFMNYLVNIIYAYAPAINIIQT